MPNLDIKQYDVAGSTGRHLVLDPRSLAYRRAYDGQPLRATAWEPRIPVLDQQNLTAQGIHLSQAYGLETDVDALGSCTGNAAAAALSVLLTKTQAAKAGLDTDDATAAERFAIDLYAHATGCDQWHDQVWPSTDCGSSGLGIAKAMRARGLIDQYGHATTAEELCALLQTGPVLLGMPWHEAFFSPVGSMALLDDIPGWESSPVAGGHEVCIIALESVALDETSGRLIPEHTVLRARNSYGTSWGDAGDFRLSLAVYEALRDEIDALQPRLDSAA